MSQSNYSNINKITVDDLSPQVQLLLQLASGSNDALKNIHPQATKTENVGNGRLKINDVEVTVYAHPTTHPASMITGLHAIATSGQYSDLIGVPNSLPASDVSAWAKATKKPVYSSEEVGAIPDSMKGVSNGVAGLDSNAIVVLDQLPSNLHDLISNDKLPDRQMPEVSIANLKEDSTLTLVFGGLTASSL